MRRGIVLGIVLGFGSMLNLGGVAYGQGDDAGAGDLVRRNNVAFELHQQGDYAGAQELFEGILAILLSTKGEEDRVTLVIKNNLAQILKRQGDLTRAREMQEEVLETQRRVLGAEHPDTLTSMHNLMLKINI